MEDGGGSRRMLASRDLPPSSIFHPPSSFCLRSRRRRRRIPELIPEASDRLDLVRPLAQLAADGGDVDVDRAVEDVGVAAEGGVDDVVAREDPAGLTGKEVEDSELGGGQGDL